MTGGASGASLRAQDEFRRKRASSERQEQERELAQPPSKRQQRENEASQSNPGNETFLGQA